MDPFTMAILGTVAQEGVKGIFGALSPKPDTVTLGNKPNFGNPATFGAQGGMGSSSYQEKQPIVIQQPKQTNPLSQILGEGAGKLFTSALGGLGGKGGGGSLPMGMNPYGNDAGWGAGLGGSDAGWGVGLDGGASEWGAGLGGGFGG